MCKLINLKPHNLSALICLLAITLQLGTPACLAETRINVLSLPDLSQWEAEVFSGKTLYMVVDNEGKPVIKATSNGTASGLVRHMDIDLTKTPYMNWSWKVDNVLEGVEETQKSGDDYPARVYVVISGGIFFWRTRALSYVWASRQAKGSVWHSAFTDNATMAAVESGPDKVGRWVHEKRNILDDIKKLLQLDKTEINAVAIMTDTDNSKQSATAYYGDIYFTAE
ncbi:MAG: DUF3047 domain-containing protein [Gammaproteobacteria bacterium]